MIMKKLFSASLLFSALIANVAFGQDSTKTAETKPMEMAVPSGPLKTFGGAKQFSRWSLGISGGGLSPVVALGGLNQFSSYKTELGYSAFLKWQLKHSFGLRLDYLGGKLTGNSSPSSQNANATSGPGAGTDVSTMLNYAISIKGEVDVASIDFLRRENAVRVFVTAGYGLANFTPDATGTALNAGFFPVGAGLKIKASRSLAINLSYDAMFFDASNLFGNRANEANDARQSKASYGSVGLEYTFGARRKPPLVWSNPVAIMYDELKANDSLAKEVTAVKNRIATAEGDVSNLKKDSDGDGVSDVFDKCPNTPAGTKVDGAGCELPKPEIVMPKVDSTKISDEDIKVVQAAIKNLNFETAKSVIKSSSNQYLDKLATLMNAKPASKLSLKGYTDSQGKAASNLALSTGRANSVKDYLVGKGVDGTRITAEGFGSANPVASNKTSKGRAKNRRVEFNLM